ncbi:oligosaccharide flippase family protein [Alteromonas confluentis]|uniref:Uncharacterized protein n=1 Tax=Alteromonas confluentis TaxID=1656094 RepID=A0A1E7Z8T2_9ALTE|nr:oligosaccharide flippase family protein [Alteromonas confluentis]OFC69929.1 hypothetical protein BFC18_15870 [Alteromonas confluentis]
MSVVKTRLSHLFWVFFERFGLVGLSIISFLLYAQYLTPEEMGLGILLLALVELCSAFTIAIVDNSIIRLREMTPEQDGTSFWSLVGFSTLLAVLIYTGYWFYFDDPRTRLIGLLAVTALPFQVSERLHIVHLRKQKKFKKLANRTLIGKLSGIFAGVSLAISGFGDFAIVMQTVTMAMVSATILLVIEKRQLPFTFDRRFVIEQLGVGVPSSIKVMNMTVFMKGIVLLIESALGTAFVGYYNFALRLVELPRTALLSALMGYANPVYASRNNAGKPLDVFFLQSTKFALLVIMPCFVGLSLVADPLIRLIFGEKWVNAITMLQGISAITAFNLFFMFLPSCLIAYGKTKLGLKGQILASIAGLLTVVFFINDIGLISVIYGLLLRTFVSFIVNLVVLQKIFVVSTKDFMNYCKLPIVGCTAMFAGVFLLNNYVDFTSLLIEIITEVAVGTLCYLISIFLLERRIIQEFSGFIKAKA